RQVEARFARVALPASPTAQLIVDPARLMPLGAQHVEPAERRDLLGLRRADLLPAREDFLHRLLVFVRLLHRVEATLAELLSGEELGVPAEQDVGTTAGHVRRDGHRALPAG